MTDRPSRFSRIFRSPLFKVALIILLVVLVGRAFIVWRWMKKEEAQISLNTLGGVEVSYLLTPKLVDSLPGPLAKDFDVTPDGKIIMRGGDTLLEIESGQDKLILDKVTGDLRAPDSYALSNGTTLLTISGQYFGQFEDGSYTQAVPLPSSGMRLSPSSNPGTVYMLGPPGAETSRRLYAFYADGRLDILVELPEEIIAVTDNQQAVYLSTRREIFRSTLKQLELVMRLPESDGPIISLAVSQDNQVLYFSTGKRVYAMHGLAAIAVVRDAGGMLRVRGGNLYVWDQDRKLLVSLSKLDQVLLSN